MNKEFIAIFGESDFISSMKGLCCEILLELWNNEYVYDLLIKQDYGSLSTHLKNHQAQATGC